MEGLIKNFIQGVQGKRVDTDGFPEDAPYQCVDVIKLYMRDLFDIPFGTYGNAIDYWVKPHKNVLTKFRKVRTTSAKLGDIVILNGLPGNKYGHIGVATGNTTSAAVEILEQNGSTGRGQGTGGDVCRNRSIERSRIAGVLRPKVLEQAMTESKYTVKSGDSLSKIAERYNSTWQQLYAMNRDIVSDPNVIRTGQVLRVPSKNGVAPTYIVKRGDTLIKIADRHGMTWNRLYELNRSLIGHNPNKIVPGQSLRLR